MTNNVAGSSGGGGISNVSGVLTATNCTFTGNTATTNDGGVYGGGGALSIIRGTTVLTNDIFSGDSSPQGGGDEIFFNNNGTPGTLTITHCDLGQIVGAYTDGGGNLSADPLFVNASAGDFHLLPGSSCLGAGTADAEPPTDKDGTVRPTPPSIGAYDAGDLVLLSVPSPISGGTVVTATVILSGITSSAVVIGLSSSDSSVVRVNRGVIIPAGSSSATFTINTYRSHVTKTVTIRASLGLRVLTIPLTITGR